MARVSGDTSTRTQWKKSVRGRSAGTSRPSWLTSSGRVGTSGSTHRTAKDRVPSGTSDQARCGLRLPARVTWVCGSTRAKALRSGMTPWSGKDSLYSFMGSSVGASGSGQRDPSELAFADLHDIGACRQQQGFVFDAVAIDAHAALLDIALRFGCRSRQPRFAQHLQDAHGRGAGGDFGHVVGDRAVAEPGIELLQGALARTGAMEPVDDLAGQQDLGVARIAPGRDFCLQGADF